MVQKKTFHRYERELQNKVLTAEAIESGFGLFFRKNFLPKYREFYDKLQLLYLSTQDAGGSPVVLAFTGPPGFIRTTQDEMVLRPHSPVEKGLFPAGKQVAILGLVLQDRDRYRMNGTVVSSDSQRLRLRVGYSYGNCPKYIQARRLEVHAPIKIAGGLDPSPIKGQRVLDQRHQHLVAQADTFFIGTYVDEAEDDVDAAAISCDISHRGGAPGFVQMSRSGGATQLTWGDYRGNNFFNTLGNILANGQAALLFIDFQTGDTLICRGLPIQTVGPPEYSPYNPAASLAARVQCVGIEDAAHGIKTFTWSAPQPAIIDGKPTAFTHTAGQFGSFNFQDLEAPGGVTNRTWTISSHPDQLASSNTFAITVKRAGLVSSWLHDHLRVGDQIGWGGVDGQFTADPSVKHAVLIGGGIGITPLRSMFHTFLKHGIHITLLYSIRHSREGTFMTEFLRAAEGKPRQVKVHVTVSGADAEWKGPRGRLSSTIIKTLVPDLLESAVYLCGPEAFMDGVKTHMENLGLPSSQIFTESFSF
ncbi:hypothetical protein WJX84_003348 [Apatococcus fuscideae]|uniref:FAD-binding FR-type domain-containing protein n=1 Tax=Apatococcus fuscideae TaxID=2026836 RepID=A0AAW1TEK8_9CHLO